MNRDIKIKFNECMNLYCLCIYSVAIILCAYHYPHSDTNVAIDECSSNNGGCDHICTDTAGSFECSCNTGYALTADGLTCMDTDECQLNTDNCQQTCTNTAGGFTCSCNSGYTLNGDGRTCDGELKHEML